jgi:hypothetical protein
MNSIIFYEHETHNIANSNLTANHKKYLVGILNLLSPQYLLKSNKNMNTYIQNQKIRHELLFNNFLFHEQNEIVKQLEHNNKTLQHQLDDINKELEQNYQTLEYKFLTILMKLLISSQLCRTALCIKSFYDEQRIIFDSEEFKVATSLLIIIPLIRKLISILPTRIKKTEILKDQAQSISLRIKNNQRHLESYKLTNELLI